MSQRTRTQRAIFPGLFLLCFSGVVSILLAEPAPESAATDPRPRASSPSTSRAGVSTAAPAAQTQSAVPGSSSGPVRIRLTAIGDVNFNRNRLPVQADGVDVWGTLVPFADMTRGLTGLLDGDLNFANVETVVTDRNDFEPPEKDKLFCFRTHPNAIRALLETKFNLFNLANNHAFDYGETGILETVKHLELLADEQAAKGSPLYMAGIGKDFDRASSPALITLKGIRIAFSAIGIGPGADAVKPGGAHVSRYREPLRRLKDAPADLRIVSLHDGKEGILFPIDRQMRISREAVRDFGADIVLNHHSHRAAGIERYGDSVIFYGLGNGIMRGAADITGKVQGGLLADFGLLVAVDVDVYPSGHPQLRTLEALPLVDMHKGPRALSDSEADRRLQTLNALSQQAFLEQDSNESVPPNTRFKALSFAPKGNRGVVEWKDER